MTYLLSSRKTNKQNKKEVNDRDVEKLRKRMTRKVRWHEVENWMGDWQIWHFIKCVQRVVTLKINLNPHKHSERAGRTKLDRSSLFRDMMVWRFCAASLFWLSEFYIGCINSLNKRLFFWHFYPSKNPEKHPSWFPQKKY